MWQWSVFVIVALAGPILTGRIIFDILRLVIKLRDYPIIIKVTIIYDDLVGRNLFLLSLLLGCLCCLSETFGHNKFMLMLFNPLLLPTSIQWTPS